MPVYTYRCSNCGVQFEKQQSYTDQSLLRCPECGRRSLKKIFLPVGIVFKGSGFYATDHHSPSGQQSKKADTKSEEKTEEKKESKEPSSQTGGKTDTSSEKTSDSNSSSSSEKKE
mgnify:CR=1 FL=1|jgi:putative FmdB family regulatory protein